MRPNVTLGERVTGTLGHACAAGPSAIQTRDGRPHAYDCEELS